MMPALYLLPSTSSIILIGWAFYLVGLMKAYVDMRKVEPPSVCVVALIYTFMTHLWYGAKFVQVLATDNLVSKLR